MLAGPMMQPTDVEGVKDRKPVAAKYGATNQYAVIPPKKKVELWAKFNAPAAGVTKVELYLPTVSMPFEGVELR